MRTQDTGHRTQETGHRTHDTGHRTQDTEQRTEDRGHLGGAPFLSELSGCAAPMEWSQSLFQVREDGTLRSPTFENCIEW